MTDTHIHTQTDQQCIKAINTKQTQLLNPLYHLDTNLLQKISSVKLNANNISASLNSNMHTDNIVIYINSVMYILMISSFNSNTNIDDIIIKLQHAYYKSSFNSTTQILMTSSLNSNTYTDDIIIKLQHTYDIYCSFTPRKVGDHWISNIPINTDMIMSIL